MNAAEARKMVDELDVENSDEVQKIYKYIESRIKAEKPAPGQKMNIIIYEKFSGATIAHLNKQGYQAKYESDRDGGFTRIEF